MDEQQRRQVAIGGLAGMAGAACFVLVFTLEGWLRPDYSPIAQFVSELALGPRGWVQAVNFLLSGALLILFARGSRAAFAGGRGAKAAPILFGLIGLGLFLSGFFVMDPFSTPRSDWSLHGTVHQLLGAMVFVLMPSVAIVLLRRFWIDPVWQGFRWWTVVVVVVMIAAVVLLRVGPAVPPAPPNDFNPWRGLIQRFLLIPFMFWLFTIAWKMRRLTARA